MGNTKLLVRQVAVFFALLLIISGVIVARPLSLSEPPLFNPGRGFSMVVLLTGGGPFAVPLILASWLANFCYLKHTLWVSAILAVNNVLTMWLGALLIKKLCRGRNPARDPKDWTIFILLIVPTALVLRFGLDALPLRFFNPNFSINWAQIYSKWIWIDVLGLVLSFPFFMELLNCLSERKPLREFYRDLVPLLIGNLLGVFVFFDPHFEKFGLPKYLPFYFSLVGLMGIAYFVNPLFVAFSILLQGLGANWGHEGILLGHSNESQSELWDLRFFLFALGIITPILSSLFRKANEDTFKKSFALVSSALGATSTENDLISVASKSDTVAVGVFDMNYRVLHLNEKFAAIAGTPIEAQIGKTSDERIGPNSRHMKEVFEKIKSTGRPVWNYRLSFEAWQQVRQQELLCNYIPIFSKTGEVVGVIVVSTEITDKLNKEQLLKNEIKSDDGTNASKVLSLAVTHDLQEPLRNVNQALKILQEKFKSSADFEVKSFVESALDASSKVHAMLKGSLELSKLDHEIPELTNLSFQALVQEIVDRYRSQLNELGAQVHVETNFQIKGDRELLIRLIQNLLSNSIKYRSEKPLVVKISGSVLGAMYQVCFSDNGVGFSKRDGERIFAPFQRLHTNDEISGYGLGLSICRKIVELHGGKIWAESQLDQGARFYCTLPVV